MGAYLFLLLMAVWLTAIATLSRAAKARLREEERGATARAALLIAMTRIPCAIPVGTDRDPSDM
jgi:hypothetical protein